MKLRLILVLTFTAGAGRARAAEPVAAPAAGAPAPSTGPGTVSSVPAATPTASRGVTPRSTASDATVAPATTFDTFRLVSERNIFNPNRTGRRDRVVEEKPARLDVITLVGTMESDRGVRAFFDGSEAGFRKALRVGESLDKFKVVKISPHAVELERDGKNMAVAVGQQLRRPEGADWTLVGEDVARRDAQAQAVADAKVDPSAPPVIPAGASEVEKRMMERRMKNLRN